MSEAAKLLVYGQEPDREPDFISPDGTKHWITETGILSISKTTYPINSK